MRGAWFTALSASAVLLAGGMDCAQARGLGTLLIQVQQDTRICASREVELQSLRPVRQKLSCFGRTLDFQAWPRAAQGDVELALQAKLRTLIEEHWVLVRGQWVTFPDERLDTLAQTIALRDGARISLPLGNHVRIDFRLEAVSGQIAKHSAAP